MEKSAANAKADKSQKADSSKDSASRVRPAVESSFGDMDPLRLLHGCRGSACSPSLESVAQRMALMPAAQRRQAAQALQRSRGNRFVQAMARAAQGPVPVQAKMMDGAARGDYERAAEVSQLEVQAVQRQANPKLEEAAEEEVLPDKFGSNELTAQPMQAQPKSHPNRTGMPDRLKAGIESLSGIDMSDVRVHANSRLPARLNALAYTQGNHIYLGPGQERHLPHEAWHAVQQKQGRVRATRQMSGVAVNDEGGLEGEADGMGDRALCGDAPDIMRDVENVFYGSRGCAEQKKGVNSFSSIIGEKKLHLNAALPVQCRFTQAGTLFSFLSRFDLAGNPYMVSIKVGSEKAWKFGEVQDNVKMTEAPDLFEKIDDAEKRKMVRYNISMGRQQGASIEGQKAVLVPFKTYTFGVDKRPDIAVFNVSGGLAEAGKLYKNYKTNLLTIKSKRITNELTLDAAKDELEKCRKEMLPLISFGEDYRIGGDLFTEEDASKHFNEKWEDLKNKFDPIFQKGELATEDERRQLDEAIENATMELPWAGKGGKGKYMGDLGRSEKRDRPVESVGASPESKRRAI